jgi:pyruvate dehydrogenase E2 component (dihydrolipoamide acetyltransferase)
MAAAMWRNPSDPTIYGSVDVDVTHALAFIERFRRDTGLKLTLTHVVARAVARALARHPELNAKVRFWGRIEQREHVDLMVSVSTEGGRDLSAARIEQAEDMSLAELVRAVSDHAARIRTGADRNFARSRNVFRSLPWWLARPIVRLTDLLTNELHVHLPSQGMPRDPFGSAIVTNVGMFGIDTAFAPFVPLARCPLLILVTEVKERPWVVDGHVVARPVLRLCGTFDHRIIDGYHAGLLARDIHALVERPDAAEDAAPAAAVEPATVTPLRAVVASA